MKKKSLIILLCFFATSVTSSSAQIDMEDAKTIVVGTFRIGQKIAYDIRVRKNEKKLREIQRSGRVDADCWYVNYKNGNLEQDKEYECWINGVNYGKTWCSICKEREQRLIEEQNKKREQKEKEIEYESQLKQQYVDLGLPSGTLWKKWNENELYEYQDAVNQFGNQIPTKSQWEELMNLCQWQVTNNGYRVVGPNGNSIDLVEDGFIMCDQTEKLSVGGLGFYTSSTSSDEEEFYWSLVISADKCFGDDISDCWKKSVRLIR